MHKFPSQRNGQFSLSWPIDSVATIADMRTEVALLPATPAICHIASFPVSSAYILARHYIERS